MARRSKRAARRRRWKLAIGGIVVAGLCVAWWLRSGGQLPPLQAESPAVPAASATTVVATVTLPPPAATTPAASAATSTGRQIAELDAAHARDAAWAEARRESIRVQQRLREEAAAQRARADALERGDEMRCIDGRRMRRVANGWVDAGTC